MKIYGLDVSNPTNKVRYVATYLGIPYELEHVMPMSEQAQSSEYRAINPLGKVPALQDDDGFTLFESAAIIKYLAQKHHSSLYPTDLKQRAIVDQWMDYVSIHIRGAYGRVFWNRIGINFTGEEADVNSLNAGLKFLDRFLPILENQLAKTRYLAGEQLTVADFNLLAELDGAEMADIDISKYPSLDKWRKGLQNQDFYKVDRSKGQAVFDKMMPKV